MFSKVGFFSATVAFTLISSSSAYAAGAAVASLNLVSAAAKQSSPATTINETSLPLRLVAIHRGNSPIAIIETVKGSEKSQDVFGVGASIFGIAELQSVATDGVWILNNGSREFLASRPTGLGSTNVATPSQSTSGVTIGNMRGAMDPYSRMMSASVTPSSTSVSATDSGKAPKQPMLLASDNSGPTPLKVVDRRELFQNVRNFPDLLQAHKPRLTRSADGSLALQIGEVPANSPVAELGIQAGDVFKSINGTKFNNPADIYAFVTKMSNDDILTVEVDRGGSPQQLSFASQYPERITAEKIDEIKKKQSAHIEQIQQAAESAPAESAPANVQTAAAALQANMFGAALTALAGMN